jgi:hypothetical protein
MKNEKCSFLPKTFGALLKRKEMLVALYFSFFIFHFSFLHAQTDSLRNAAIERSQQLNDSLKPAFPSNLVKERASIDSLPAPKRNPFIEKNEEGRLQVNVNLPGRKPIAWKVPKIIYAGASEFPDPNVSWQRSMLVPGWGQVYNGDSWKLPIIYTGYAAAGWYYSDRQSQYQNFRRAYRIRVLESTEEYRLTVADTAFLADNNLTFASIDGLRRQRDQLRRQRDYAVLYIAAWHLLSVAEAFVGGHMKSVDISEDISMKVTPDWIRMPGRSGAVGLGVTFQF